MAPTQQNPNVAYFGSIRLTDIDFDGRADVCGRGRDGVVCGLSNGASFAAALPLMPHDYTDSHGWLVDRCGPTLQLADLNNDKRADICGHGTAGLLRAFTPRAP